MTRQVGGVTARRSDPQVPRARRPGPEVLKIFAAHLLHRLGRESLQYRLASGVPPAVGFKFKLEVCIVFRSVFDVRGAAWKTGLIETARLKH